VTTRQCATHEPMYLNYLCSSIYELITIQTHKLEYSYVRPLCQSK